MALLIFTLPSPWVIYTNKRLKEKGKAKIVGGNKRVISVVRRNIGKVLVTRKRQEERKELTGI